MLTRYLPHPDVPGTCLHNTANWQVTEMMGGLACELLAKTRLTSAVDRGSLPLHACYPSLFLQGDEATAFLEELRNAQSKLSPKRVDELLLSAYSDVVH